MTIASAFIVRTRLTIKAKLTQTMKMMSDANRQSPLINTQDYIIRHDKSVDAGTNYHEKWAGALTQAVVVITVRVAVVVVITLLIIIDAEVPGVEDD
jgi:hypothetical protein